MTVSTDDIGQVLRSEWSQAVLVGEPTPVTGGEWATMLRLEVAGTPDGVPADLVLRLAPHPEMAAKEVAVQRAAAEAGVATPAIRASGPPGGPLREAWALMDFAPGTPLLASLDGVGALPRLPGIARRLPRELAASMASIHRLDAVPIAARARAAAPSAALTVTDLLPHLHAGVEGSARADLASSLERLVDARPPEADLVLCHGDVHPLNLLVDGDHVTVLDWTAAILAPAAYDVAWTWFLLRHPPVVVPSFLRTAVGGAGRLLARRFLRAYEMAAPNADLTDLDWYVGVHAARVLVDLALWEVDGDARAATHPGRLMAPGASAALARATERTQAGVA